MPSPRLPHRNDLTFPARDEGFAALVGRLSDPAPGPHADNLLSNEDSFPRVAGALRKRSRPGDVYLGVGPDQNYTYIAQTLPSLAFLLDHRRRNLLLHLLHRALFSLSDDRVAYLERLTARRPVGLPPRPDAEALTRSFARTPLEPARLAETVAEVAAVLRPLGVLRREEFAEVATIHARLAGPGMGARFLALPMYPTFARLIATPDRDGQPAHVLATEPLYQAVRDRTLADRIIPVVGDLADAPLFNRLGDWLRARSFRVGVFYASDVEFFLLRAGRFPAYVANLGRLPWSDRAVIVRTSTREIAHPERHPGDSSTTVLRAVSPFLDAARTGRILSPDDLFRSF